MRERENAGTPIALISVYRFSYSIYSNKIWFMAEFCNFASFFQAGYVFSMFMLVAALLGVKEAIAIDDPGLRLQLDLLHGEHHGIETVEVVLIFEMRY